MLNTGSWEHLVQIPTVTVTFVQASYVNIRNILTVTDTIKTKLYRQGQGKVNANICPGDICPHQQYLSCYWFDLDETLNLVQVTYALVTFVHISNISAVTNPNLTKRFGPQYQQYLTCYLLHFDQTFWTQFLVALIFVEHIFWTRLL